MSEVNDNNPEFLTTIAKQLELSHFAFVASLAWFVWDYFLTLPNEVHVIWQRRFTLGSFLYAANILTCIGIMSFRIPLHLWANVSVNLCSSIFKAVLVLQASQMCILQLVLALRTYAVYNCNKRVLVPLLVLSLTSFVLDIVDTIGPLDDSVYSSNPLPIPYNGCISPSSYRPWPPIALLLAFEVVVGVLMVARLVVVMKKNGCSLAHVEYIVYRDGLVESAVMSVLLISDLMYPTGNSPALRPMWCFIPLAGYIACKRLLLSLRYVTQSELGTTSKHVVEVDGITNTDRDDTPYRAETQADEFYISTFDEEPIFSPHGDLECWLGRESSKEPQISSHLPAFNAPNSLHKLSSPPSQGSTSTSINPTLLDSVPNPEVASGALLHPPRSFSLQHFLAQNDVGALHSDETSPVSIYSPATFSGVSSDGWA
ncbi:hypothetical protein DL93DRAFT_601408 [Clavulina sp. PMI_390]|nr:hypothetical protein DL93DRAFT_601408 [Clavulina sp. PMI_390]